MENRAATFKDIQDSRQATQKDIQGLRLDTNGLKGDVQDLKTDVRELKTDVVELKSNVTELKTDVQDIKETIEFLKENAASRDELYEVRDELNEKIATLATKDDVRELSNKMTTIFDSFVKSHNNFVSEMAAYRHQGHRHEARIETIEHLLHITPAI